DRPARVVRRRADVLRLGPETTRRTCPARVAGRRSGTRYLNRYLVPALRSECLEHLVRDAPRPQDADQVPAPRSWPRSTRVPGAPRARRARARRTQIRY